MSDEDLNKDAHDEQPDEAAAGDTSAEEEAAGDSEEISAVEESSEASEKDNGSIKNIERVLDVDLELIVKIGELRMRLRDVLDLHSGSIIEIDRSVDSPLDLLIGSKILAQGEVVTVGESLGLRIKKRK